MANRNSPFGLQPLRQVNGAAPTTERFPLRQAIQSTKYDQAIYKGSFVLWANTGWVKYCAVTNPATVVGIAAESYLGSAVSTQTDIAVWEASKHIFTIQASNLTAGSTTSINDVRLKNCSVEGPTLGNTTNGYSKMQASVTAATSADRVLTILGSTDEIGESTTGQYMKLEVRINSGRGYEEAVQSP